jgi:hypothetical protein
MYEIIGTADFIGINYYYSIYVSNCPLDKGVRDYTTDMSISYKSKHNCFFVHNFVAAVVGNRGQCDLFIC